MDITSFIQTILVMSAATVVLSEYLSKYTKAEGSWARIQSWAVAVGLGVAASWLNFGAFTGMSWMGGALMGIVSALAANGIFTIDLVKRLLVAIRARVESGNKA